MPAPLAPCLRQKLASRGSSGSKENAVNLPPPPGPRNAVDPLIAALRGKISQQAEELTALNDELVRTREEKHASEQRVNELVARAAMAPLRSGGNKQQASTSMASKRKFEKEAALKVDALEKALESAELRQAEWQKQKATLEHKLEESKKSDSQHMRKVLELNTEVECLKSNLDYAQRTAGGLHTNRANTAAAKLAVSRSSSHIQHEEARRLRDQLEKTTAKAEQSAKASKRREDSLLARLIELEDALLSEAASNADRSPKPEPSAPRRPSTPDASLSLAAENARLRGELTAIRASAASHQEDVAALEAEKSRLRAKADEAEQRVADLLQRLQTQQLENDRLHIGEVGARLRVVEKERDVLVEYVQAETVKHSESSARAEAAEAALRSSQLSEQAALEKLKHTASVLEAERQRREGVEGRLLGLAELQAALEDARSEKTALEALLNRRELEAEEVRKMHRVVLERCQAKEALLEATETEVKAMRTRAAEQEERGALQAQSLKDASSLLHGAQADLAAQRERVKALEPLVSVEQEAARLRVLVSDLQAEAEALRPSARLLSELRADFDELEARRDEPLDFMAHLPLSSAHSAWVSLPSLRHLSPPLFERVRAAASDLFRVESEVRELRLGCSTLQRELDLQRQEATGAKTAADEAAAKANATAAADRQLLQEAREKFAAVERNLLARLQKTESDARAKLSALEGEAAALKPARMALEQVRASVRAFASSSAVAAAAVASGAGQKKGTASFDPNTGRPLPAEPLDCSKLTDEQITDVVGNILASQASCARELKDSKHAAERAKTDLNQALEKARAAAEQTSDDNKRLNEEVHALRAAVSKLKGDEKGLRSELRDASSVIEKQNALGATLESKVRHPLNAQWYPTLCLSFSPHPFHLASPLSPYLPTPHASLRTHSLRA